MLTAIFGSALTAVIVLCFIVAARPVGWLPAADVSHGGSAARPPAGTLPRLRGVYRLAPGEAFALTVPVGAVDVATGPGRTVQVRVSFAGGHTVPAAGYRAALARTRLINSGTRGGVRRVVLAEPHFWFGVPSVRVSVRAPRGSSLILTDRVGRVRVNGTFSNLALHVRVGEVRARAGVQNRLSIQDNVGAVAFRGLPGRESDIVANLGAVNVAVPVDIRLRIAVIADMGSIVDELPLHSAAQGGPSLSGDLNGRGPQRALRIQADLGNVTLRAWAAHPAGGFAGAG